MTYQIYSPICIRMLFLSYKDRSTFENVMFYALHDNVSGLMFTRYIFVLFLDIYGVICCYFVVHIAKCNRSLHDFRLPPRSGCELRSFELLRSE